MGRPPAPDREGHFSIRQLQERGLTIYDILRQYGSKVVKIGAYRYVPSKYVEKPKDSETTVEVAQATRSAPVDFFSNFREMIKCRDPRVSEATRAILKSLGDTTGIGKIDKVGYVLSACLDSPYPSDECVTGLENIARLLGIYGRNGAQKNMAYFLTQLSRLYEVETDGIKIVNPLRGASKLDVNDNDKHFVNNCSQGGMLATSWKAFARDWRRSQTAGKNQASFPAALQRYF